MRILIFTTKLRKMILASTIATMLSTTTPAYSQTQDISSTSSTSSFQKTDTSLLYEIETNLKKYDYSGTNKKEELVKPPKQRRFEIAEKGITKLIYKNSMPNTLYGGVIGVAATAHPAGFLLGGITGLLQGKSDRYEEAQERIHQMKMEIFESANHELTEDEILLASYTGTDLSEFTNLAPKPDIEILSESENIIKETDSTSKPPLIDTAMGGPTNNEKTKEIEVEVPSEMVIATEEALPPPDVDYCHDLMIGNTKPVDNKTRRELVSFCFYHMN